MNAELPTTAILAGGLGTRLGSLTKDVPKPLIPVAGRPFLLHQLDLLARNGAREVVLCVGYRGEQIEAVIGSEQFGITISYSYDGPDLDGTLGAIRRALPRLGERFLVLYGDTYLPVDFAEIARVWEESDLPGMMTVLHNQGELATSNAAFDGYYVTRYDKAKPDPEMEWIDYGLTGLCAEALSHSVPEASDLAGIFSPLAKAKLLRGIEVTERFHEIGSPEALQETATYLIAHGEETHVTPGSRS